MQKWIKQYKLGCIRQVVIKSWNLHFWKITKSTTNHPFIRSTDRQDLPIKSPPWKLKIILSYTYSEKDSLWYRSSNSWQMPSPIIFSKFMAVAPPRGQLEMIFRQVPVFYVFISLIGKLTPIYQSPSPILIKVILIHLFVFL